jgi:hypothetical protein
MSTARMLNSIWESCAEAQALVYASLHRSVRCGWIGDLSWIDALENSWSNSDFSSARFKSLDIMSHIVFPEERDAGHSVRALKYGVTMTCIILSRRAEYSVGHVWPGI